MARPLRTQYPGAWYHAMNRGRRGDPLFADKGDSEQFIELLKETTETWNLRISAFCLIRNHHHLLVQTPDGNLSRYMRHSDGVYTQRFNRMHPCYTRVKSRLDRFTPSFEAPLLGEGRGK